MADRDIETSDLMCDLYLFGAAQLDGSPLEPMLSLSLHKSTGTLIAKAISKALPKFSIMIARILYLKYM